MHAEVRDALGTVRADASARVLLLTGAGRGFCAGQDLGDRAVAPGGAPVDLGASIERNYKPLVLALRALPLPVICAVNGVAAGAGANLALACDIVIAAKSASFIEAFCKLGLIPDTGGTYFLPRLVGTARAMGLAMLGDKLSAEQAAAWGLIWQCVDDAELPAVADRLLAHFATAPTRGLARTKEALYASPANTLEAQLDLERDFMRELGYSDDYREGVAAFVAKRPPTLHRSLSERTVPMAALAPSSTVAVIGAGTMGAGIAQIAALRGHAVQLHDTRFGAADAAKTGIADALAQAGRQGKARAADADAALDADRDRGHAARRLRRVARRRSDRRGSRREARALRAARERRRARVHPRVEHVVAVDHRARHGPQASGPRRRHALLQPGAADAAGRGRDRARDRSPAVAATRLRHRRRLGQDAGPCGVDAGLHRQPLRAAVLRRRPCACSPKRAADAGDDRRGACAKPAASGWARSS